MKTKEDWEKERLAKIKEAEKRVQYFEDNYDREEVLSFVTVSNIRKGRSAPYMKLIKFEDSFHFVEITRKKEVHLIRQFSTIDDFWNYFTADKNWYKNRPSNINSVLFKRIIESTNEIRLTQKLSFTELGRLKRWNDKPWDASTRILLKGRCPNCEKKRSDINGYLCSNCMKLVTDVDGNKITLILWGNYYTETKEKYKHNFGFLNGAKVVTRAGPMDTRFYYFAEE